ncbi:hypothetical protein BD310DRAFT_941044 [Dichomitus squalens]|uniref:Uncharacterized protein n=1 Tax=Dichomitus squalens TaxID=114155 RepID=A0A4Q9PH63_9APHY|nr:hypothetical protein BD310DRAFT_941044 [Dichomitus squalens]
MSARAPFVPRPASRVDTAAADKAQLPSSPSGYEPFRANVLLNATDSQGLGSQEHSSSRTDAPPPPPPSHFKPLNLSGLARAKNISRPQSALSRSSGSSRAHSRSPKSITSQQKPPGLARPSSPFFPSAGLVSMNAFLSPLPHQRPRDDSGQYGDFSSNKAHIVQSNSFSFDDHKNAQNNLPQTQDTDSPRFFDPPLAAPRSRTASHPSLASIHEVDEDGDGVPSRHAQSMGPPPTPDLGSFDERGFDPHHNIDRRSPSLRRPMKRTEPALETGEEHEYGTAAKRYKSAIDEDEYTSIYSGRTTPAAHHGPGLDRPATRAPGVVPLQDSFGAQRDGHSKQALYRLLGQDLDICIEAHADAYEQARKKWSECSIDEWTKGADGT